MKSFVKFRSNKSRRRQARRFSPWQMLLERLESRSLLSSATITPPATQTTLEDTAKVVSGLIFTSTVDPVTVTLSVTNGTLALNTGVAGGVTAAQVTGSGTSQISITANVANVNTTLANATGLTYTPSTDFSGSDSLAININNLTDSVNATTTLTVTSVNDTPSFTKGGNQTVLEDTAVQSVSAWATNINAGPNESTQTVDFQVTNDHNEFFSVQPAISATGTLTYTPAANQTGTAIVTVLIHDNGGVTNGGHDTSVTQTFTITLTPINDVPSFTKGANQTILEDAGAQSVPGWATGISKGPANESGQVVNFIVSSDNPGLFSTQPAVAADGTLTFTPAPNANGTTTVTVAIHDDGGTVNGGVDTSASQTFTITITAVNDVPSFTVGGNQTVLEDSGAQSVAAFATTISAGPNDSGQTVDFQVSNNNNALFSVQPAISATGALTYTPAANQSGVATVTVLIHDNSGTAGGGVDTSATQTFTITITGVNDVPSFTKGANQTILEDAGAQSVPGWAININAGTNEAAQVVNFIVNSDNPGLFSAQPAVASNGTLTFTPAANANGTTTITVFIHDDGGTTNGGIDTSASQTFTITITAVNDVPSFTAGPNLTVANNSAAQTVNGWASNIVAGPSDELAQTLNFIVTSSNPLLFSAVPAISTAGVLTYTPAANMTGVATVTVKLKDNGGTTNGGVDTSVPQTFTISIGTAALPVAPAGMAVYTAPANAKLRAFVVNGLLSVQINGIPYPTYAPASVTSLTINGGSKNDEVNLSGLDPLAYTGLVAGIVKINGGAGNDLLVGSFAKDSIDGGSGNDTLTGGLGDDKLIGNAGTDLLVESGNVNLILTDTSLTGGLGSDKLFTIENASLTGGDSGVDFNASAFTRGVVMLVGGAGNDSLTGGSKNDAITGRDGNDTLVGGAGNDTLLGGFGIDSLSGGDGDDLLIGGFDGDVINGGLGRDTAVGGQGGAVRGGTGVADAGDLVMNSEVINEAFKKLFAWE